jgi:uncharacterized membrane protein
VERVPAWLRNTDGENRAAVTVSIAVAIASQMFLPDRLALGPAYALPAIEIVLYVALSAANPFRMRRQHKALRIVSLMVVALMSVANAVSAGTLVDEIARGKAPGGAPSLLATGAEIYVTNIVAFALWYWEFDRGGPFSRARGDKPYPDFMFPQMSSPELTHPDWEPFFLDYLYVSFTNATAFSPTDTMPMSRWAKTLMALQSGVALITVAFVLARAVNILKG